MYDIEDEGSNFLRNLDELLPDSTASHPRSKVIQPVLVFASLLGLLSESEIKVACSSETSASFNMATRRHHPQDR
jgi:hypothetical protein